MKELSDSLRRSRLERLRQQWCRLSEEMIFNDCAIYALLGAQGLVDYKDGRILPSPDYGGISLGGVDSPEDWKKGIPLWSYQEECDNWKAGLLSGEGNECCTILHEYYVSGDFIEFTPILSIGHVFTDLPKSLRSELERSEARDLDLHIWDFRLYRVGAPSPISIPPKLGELARISASEFSGPAGPKSFSDWLEILVRELLSHAFIEHFWFYQEGRQLSKEEDLVSGQRAQLALRAFSNFDNNLANESSKAIERLLAREMGPKKGILTDLQQEVLEYIRVHPGQTEQMIREGISTEVGEGTLSRHVFPMLRERFGLMNKRGYGYYIDVD